MIYVVVHTAEPFVVVCDGKYQQQLAYQRLDRDPFSFVRTEETGPLHGLLEITLPAFLNLHSRNYLNREATK